MRAASWGYAGMVAKLVIQLGSQIFLARLLGPETYGLFAIGAIVIGLSNFLADAGIGAVLVQREEIDEPMIQFVQTFQWLAGLAVAGLLLISAPIIADFFHEPRAINIIRAMSGICFLSAISSVPANLLRRRLDFKPLQVAQVSGFFVGYVLVGIPSAWFGMGVWSLVFAWLVQALVNLFLLYRAARPSWRFRLSTPHARDALRFGGNALLSNVFTWAGTSVDKVIIGRFFPAADLGLYNVANNLLSTAVTQLLSTLQSVLFSASSRMATDRDQIRRSFLALLEIGTLILLPIFLSIAVVPDVVMAAVYGSKWVAGAELLTPIALSMAMYGISGLVTPLLWSIGRVDVESRIQLAGAICIVAAGWWAAQTGQVVHVAWAVTACVAARSVFTTIWLARLTSTNLPYVVGAIMGSLIVGITTAAGVYFVCRELQSVATAPLMLLVAVAIGLVVFIASTLVLCRLGRFPVLMLLAGRVPRLVRYLTVLGLTRRGIP